MGFRGQYIASDPARDVLVVRPGDSTTDQRGAIYTRLRDLIQSFPMLAW